MPKNKLLKFDFWSESRSIHIWIGPLGMHIFYWDLWHTKLDWEPRWNQNKSE